MSKRFFFIAFAVGLAVVLWVGFGFIGNSALALAMTVAIAAAFLVGAFELRQFRAGTAALAAALADIPQPLESLAPWLERVPASLRHAVRLRVEGERGGAMPGPALTPYLVGLLVMLGMLGTFLGMVITFRGAMFALEGSTDLDAIRSALAGPLQGLGLAFGTSVAGVAASAMLGLMSAIARRERLDVARRLDERIATVLLPFSLVHQRQETFRALQGQARALPDVGAQLLALMDKIDARGAQLDARLLERHESLQREMTQVYGELARNVGASLQESLAAGARSAGESIVPVIESAMERMTADGERMHARLEASAQRQAGAFALQLEELQAGVARNLGTLGEAFAQPIAAMERMTAEGERVQARLEASAERQAEAFARQLGELEAGVARNLGTLGEAFAQPIAAMERMTAEGERMQARLEASAERQAEVFALQLDELQAGVARNLGTLGEAFTQPIAAMERMTAEGERVQARLEASAERQAEAFARRLDELQAGVARNLGTLGEALEQPIARMLHTVAEVPQAAAGVIGELRQEMAGLAERENLALQERAQLLGHFDTLLQSMQQAGARFTEVIDAQAGKAADAAEKVGGSAIAVADLAQAFQQAVQQFQAGSEQLAESLRKVEEALERSTARSDEQLAYYVAQAREVIDLSISSQQAVLQAMRQTEAPPQKARA